MITNSLAMFDTALWSPLTEDGLEADPDNAGASSSGILGIEPTNSSQSDKASTSGVPRLSIGETSTTQPHSHPSLVAAAAAVAAASTSSSRIIDPLGRGSRPGPLRQASECLTWSTFSSSSPSPPSYHEFKQQQRSRPPETSSLICWRQTLAGSEIGKIVNLTSGISLKEQNVTTSESQKSTDKPKDDDDLISEF